MDVKTITSPVQRVRTQVRVEVLQEILSRRGIGQGELARMMDVSQPVVSRLVRGVRDPRPELRKRLMTALNLGFDDLFEIARGRDARR